MVIGIAKLFGILLYTSIFKKKSHNSYLLFVVKYFESCIAREFLSHKKSIEFTNYVGTVCKWDSCYNLRQTLKPSRMSSKSCNIKTGNIMNAVTSPLDRLKSRMPCKVSSRMRDSFHHIRIFVEIHHAKCWKNEFHPRARENQLPSNFVGVKLHGWPSGVLENSLTHAPPHGHGKTMLANSL